MTDKQSLFEQALEASRQKDFASARVLLKQLLKDDPNHTNAWLLGAHIVESRSDKIACFKRVLKLDPGNIYAYQKLSQLEAEPPVASPVEPTAIRPPPPSTEMIVAPAPPTTLQAEPSPPVVEIKPQIPSPTAQGGLSDMQVGMITLVGILLAVLCLALFGLAAMSQGGLAFSTAQPTPTDRQLFSVLHQNGQAGTSENLDAYMATLHPESTAYSQTEMTLRLIFSQYDLSYQFYNLKVISADADWAQVHFSLVTRKQGGLPAFRNNIITGTMTLKKDKGVWKIYSQTVEDTQFEN